LINLDFIGDIHGNFSKFVKLLETLGYQSNSSGWSHPEERQIVVLGDFINVGGDSKKVLQLLFQLYNSGLATVILGNHEYYLAWLYYREGEKIF
jgi:hypothetical protein